MIWKSTERYAINWINQRSTEETFVKINLNFTVQISIHEPSLCQRLDSRQLTQIRAPEAREKSSAKREHERRRRESPPEAKGERSEPFAGGARDSAKRNRVFVIMAKFLSLLSHVTCQNWIRPFTKKHRFIAQIDSARSNIASTA